MTYDYVILSLRMQIQDIDAMKKHIESRRFRNMSEGIRECCRVGLRVLQYQQMLDDPEKASEFRSKMQAILHDDQVFDWAESLDQAQLDAISQALAMEKDKRYRNEKIFAF